MPYPLSALPKPFSAEKTSEDPIMAELHAYRDQYAADFHYDWRLIYEDLRRAEEQDEFFQKLRGNVQS